MIRWLWLLAMLAPATVCAQTQVQLVAPGSVWKYRDSGADLGTSWRELVYDDSSWPSGPAELGYGDGDEQTLVGFGPDPQNKFITTYFRLGFSLANPAAYPSLGVKLLRDDGAVVYLNGVEIIRSNLDRQQPVSYTSLAQSGIGGAAESAFNSFYAPSSMLVVGTNVIAVEIHQVLPTSSDISFDLELTGNTTEVLMRGPYLQLATEDSVVVRWRSDLATPSRVAFGPSPSSLTMVQDEPAFTTEHEVTVVGLSPGTRYYYSVGSPTLVLAPPGPQQFFTTTAPPDSMQPFRAWIIGDAGVGNSDQIRVRDSYAAWCGSTHTDLWLMLGDNAYPAGSDQDHQQGVFDVYGSLLRKSPLWPTRGNHETIPGVYYGIFSMPASGQAGGVPSGTEAYYAFDWSNAHFVCLDSQGSDRSVGGAMHTWLQTDLAANDSEWLIAFWHHPPYSKGSHDSDTETVLVEMRQSFVPLLEAHGVDLVLSGHSHDYERSFLIDGHYGDSTSFAPTMKIDGGGGDPALDGAYNKAGGAHAGAVYCVAGSAGQVNGAGLLDHPAMFVGMYRLGSLALDVDGGRLEGNFIDSTGLVADRFVLLHPSYSGVYCTAKLNSAGCVPSIGSSGLPSATDPAPFTISCANVIPQKIGILVYGWTPANAAFSGGKLCIAPPIRRMAGQLASGSGLCAGAYVEDFNARIQSGVDPGLQPGVTVDAQYWYRDPPASFGVGLSDALQFTIGT